MADTVRRVDYYYATVSNRAGHGAKLMRAFQDAKVNVTALDAVCTGGKFGALLWVRRQNTGKAARALGAR